MDKLSPGLVKFFHRGFLLFPTIRSVPRTVRTLSYVLGKEEGGLGG